MTTKITPDCKIAEVKPGVWAIVAETIIPNGKGGNYWAQVTPETFTSSLECRKALASGLMRIPCAITNGD